jgi:putative ABC transport system permease protein
MTGFVKGVLSEMLTTNANLDTGHVKVMTKPYYENKDQIPIDLALLELSSITQDLVSKFPDCYSRTSRVYIFVGKIL